MIYGLELYARVMSETRFIIDKKATIRETAENFHVSKSTVYNDVSCLLPQYDDKLYDEVSTVLKENNSLKHIRGGEATKRKYLKK